MHGAVPDNRHHPAVRAQQPASVLLGKIGASSTPRGATSLAPYRPPVPDQNGFPACTAHALGCGVYSRYWYLGVSLGWVPSFLGIWTDALILENGPKTAADVAKLAMGVQSVSAMIAIGYGIRPMGALASGRFSDVVTGPVAPGLDQMVTAAMRPQVGEYRIDETQSDWTTTAAVCIDNGIPVYIGLNVGPQYMNWSPSQAPIDTDEAPGVGSGHAVRLDAYTTTASGLVFESPGSYGLAYADAGVWRFTARGLLARAFDVYPLEVSNARAA